MKLHRDPGALPILLANRIDDGRMLVDHPLRALPGTGAGQAERQPHESEQRFIDMLQHFEEKSFCAAAATLA